MGLGLLGVAGLVQQGRLPMVLGSFFQLHHRFMVKGLGVTKAGGEWEESVSVMVFPG